MSDHSSSLTMPQIPLTRSFDPEIALLCIGLRSPSLLHSKAQAVCIRRWMAPGCVCVDPCVAVTWTGRVLCAASSTVAPSNAGGAERCRLPLDKRGRRLQVQSERRGDRRVWSSPPSRNHSDRPALSTGKRTAPCSDIEAHSKGMDILHKMQAFVIPNDPVVQHVPSLWQTVQRASVRTMQNCHAGAETARHAQHARRMQPGLMPVNTTRSASGRTSPRARAAAAEDVSRLHLFKPNLTGLLTAIPHACNKV